MDDKPLVSPHPNGAQEKLSCCCGCPHRATYHLGFCLMCFQQTSAQHPWQAGRRARQRDKNRTTRARCREGGRPCSAHSRGAHRTGPGSRQLGEEAPAPLERYPGFVPLTSGDGGGGEPGEQAGNHKSTDQTSCWLCFREPPAPASSV